MTRYVFATTEFWPLTEGGAGILNAELVAMLRDAGHDAQVVLVAAEHVQSDDAHVHVVHPTDSAGWDIGFIAASKAAAEGLADLHRASSIDRIEIQDFDGLAFWTLTHRGDLGFAEIPISVRFHGPVDLQIEAMGVEKPDLAVAAQMERDSFAMADAVIVPSQGIAALAVDRYNLDSERVLVGSPIVRTLAPGRTAINDAPRFTIVGRLSEVKGSHDMVAASVPFLRQFEDATVTFIGSDGWSASANMPMKEWLSTMIPADVSDRVIFIGQTDVEQLASIVAASTAVVAPSRFESFNLAVHEARRTGVPVVLPDIPAFSGVFSSGHGAELYDGSVEALTEALVRLGSDTALVSRLADEPPPELGDPLGVYEADFPAVWHRRSQGGLATAALARVEQVRFPKPDLARHRLILQSIIRRAPDPVVGAINKLLPESMRGRIRSVSDWDWDREEARQRTDERWAAVKSRIASGQLGANTTPHVTVVIPCFNQGGFIHDALLSIFEQTDDDYDVLIVDDGSNDGDTPRILDSLDFARVEVVHQENVGLPGARNRGIAAARGKYVVTLDADDELAPRYVEKLAGLLDADDTMAFAHCWARIFGDFQAIWATRPFNRYQLLLSNSVVGCVMLRKTAWEAVGGYDETMLEGNEDWDLWIRLTEAGYGNGQVMEPLFWYRKHGVSMSVETEARYESVLSLLVERLPNVYSINHVEEVKQSSYPLISILTDADAFTQPFDDAQIIRTSHTGLESAVSHVAGKYAVWWPSSTKGDVSVLTELCEILEENESAGASETSSTAPIRVVRTWSLHDPQGPDQVVRSGLEGESEQRLSCGQFPEDSWQAPLEVGGIAVQRQRPEESGWIPDWVGA